MFVLACVLLAITLATYTRVSQAQFANYDDPEYVSANYIVKQGLTLRGLHWAFITFSAGNWHPLTWLSHMLDVQLFGLKPAGHHLVSVWIHAANALLLFWLLWKGTGHLWRSWFVAALFALHPLNVESVAWVAERKNVLSTLFGLLAIASYAWYARARSGKRYLLLLLIFVCSLMAKPMLVTLPLLLLLLDFWPLGRMRLAEHGPSPKFSQLILEKIPLMFVSAAACVVTVIAQSRGGTVRSFEFLPLMLRIQNALASYLKYLGKMFWPTKLAAFYPLLGIRLHVLLIAGCALALTAITLTCIHVRREQPYLLAGWLWYLVALVPVIGLVQVGDQAIADRYAYVPLIGIFCAISWQAAEWSGAHLEWKRVVPCAAAAILIVLAAVTWRQIGYWHDTIALFSHALDVTQNNYVAHDNLSDAFLQAGFGDEGARHARAALAINPRDGIAHYNWGTRLLQVGRINEAIEQYKITFSLPGNNQQLLARANNNLGVAYLDASKPAIARQYFEASIADDPGSYNAYAGLAMIAYNERNLPQAISDASHSVAIVPNAMGYFWLGRALEESGSKAQAIDAYQNTLRLSSGSAEARDRMNALLGKQHQSVH